MFAVGFLNVDKGVLTIEMRDDEATDWGNPERLGEILRVHKVDKGPAVLFNRKYFNRS